MECPNCGSKMDSVGAFGEIGRDEIKFWGCPKCNLTGATSLNEKQSAFIPMTRNEIEAAMTKRGFGDHKKA